MFLAIILAIIQQLAFIPYLYETSFFTHETSMNSRGVMFAVAFFTAVLSIPSFIWNYTMTKDARKWSNIFPTVLSVITFLFGIGYVILAIILRIHLNGFSIF